MCLDVVVVVAAVAVVVVAAPCRVQRDAGDLNLNQNRRRQHCTFWRHSRQVL